MPSIFISHSSRDNTIAALWKQRLEESGHLAVSLDFDPEQGIPAGREWERELYARIRSCEAMVILCSEASMASRWCFMEITHARALGKPLFAIRIDDAKLDGVLADRQAIDLRIGEEQAFAQLMRGMTVAGLDPANAFRRDATRPPYPGMLAFEEEDAAVFFGRDEEIARGLELLNRIHHLGEPPVVMVLGGSGTGKSSLVRAGLIPRLRRNREQWLIAGPVRPRTDPIEQLAGAIRRAFEEIGASPVAQEIDRTLRDDGANGLTTLLTELRLRSGHAQAKVLLVIDQFEELMTTERSGPAVVLRNLRLAAEHRAA